MPDGSACFDEYIDDGEEDNVARCDFVGMAYGTGYLTFRTGAPTEATQ